eukprot:15275319-Heterocapsa_arctica.AAC.1
MRSTSWAERILHARSRMTRRCICGRPRFWNSTTHVKAVTCPSTPSVTTSCRRALALRWKILAMRSGLSTAASQGRKFSLISDHCGLAVKVMKRSGLPKCLTSVIASK